jgi:hypothetical protein
LILAECDTATLASCIYGIAYITLLSSTIASMPIQANYINALAVSVSPFFEPAKGTLGGFIFSPWVDFFMTLGGFFMTLGELLKFVR